MKKTVTLSPTGHVLVDGEQATARRLTIKEAMILRAVMRRAGVATKEFLLQELYAGKDEPELKIIDVFTCKLRKKLGAHGAMIATTWGCGYVRDGDYEFVDGMVTLTISPKTRGMLDNLSLEADRPADQLGEELLLKGINAMHKQLWEARA